MAVKKNTLSAQIWRRFRRNKAAMAGMIVMILIILLSIASGFIYDFNEDVAKQDFAERLQGPSAEHLFGTDDIALDCTSIFGGITLHVDEHVKIKTSCTPIFGGLSNHAKGSSLPNSPTIYVNSLCMFGGVDIQ